MKKTGWISGIALVAVALATTGALAQGPGGGAWMEFEDLDTDGNGEISRAELDAHRQVMFGTVDADGDGKLSLEEIEAMMQSRVATRAAEMFDRFDADGDGAISAEEMPHPRRPGRMFDRLDADGNGTISESEFAEGRDRGRRGRQGGYGHGWRHWN